MVCFPRLQFYIHIGQEAVFKNSEHVEFAKRLFCLGILFNKNLKTVFRTSHWSWVFNDGWPNIRADATRHTTRNETHDAIWCIVLHKTCAKINKLYYDSSMRVNKKTTFDCPPCVYARLKLMREIFLMI